MIINGEYVCGIAIDAKHTSIWNRLHLPDIITSWKDTRVYNECIIKSNNPKPNQNGEINKERDCQ